ncbi:zinc-dependent alcohol dehydrogenase family protein [Elusimicrobiota bacterium]
MRAVIFHGPQFEQEAPLIIQTKQDPVPKDNETIIRVKACAVCRTDLHIYEGELPDAKLPLVFGHQVVGIDEKTGKRVGVPWLFSACGECVLCGRGRENLCDKAEFTGYTVNGGYADTMIARSEFVHPIPDALSDHEAAPLLCGGAIGMRALWLSEAKKGSKLGLFGFGASAHLVLQAANFLGMETYVFTRTRDHQKLAQSLGAKWVGDAQGKPPHLLDSAIIFAPFGPLVPLALAKLAKGGTLALAGIHMSRIPAFDYNLLYHEKKITSVANVTRKDVSQCLELAAKAGIKPKVEVFPLKSADKVLQLVKKSKISGSAVLSI